MVNEHGLLGASQQPWLSSILPGTSWASASEGEAMSSSSSSSSFPPQLLSGTVTQGGANCKHHLIVALLTLDEVLLVT